jgi:WD40 repeat protein
MAFVPDTKFGRYEIRSLVYAGDGREIYLAQDTKLNRLVALKFFDNNFDDEALHPFEHEAKAASRLNHPNILTVYDAGVSDSSYFIATEYVEGKTLREKISNAPIEINEAVDIALQILSALKTAHEARLVHNDIKPENIMLRDDGLLKVLDFGLAQFQSGNNSNSRSGTIYYMSPEQACGAKTDARTDLWSLGVVLFEMLTGQKLFDGDNTTEVLNSIFKDEPKSLSAFRDDVPLELEEILRRALEKNAGERYQSAKDFSDDLKRLREMSEPPAVAGGSAAQKTRPLTQAVLTSKPSWFNYFKKKETIAIRPRGVAFRGLLPFQEADRERFYGREIETNAVCEMIVHHLFRFGVLFGESGCGKTSLVRAAVVPALREKSFLPVYCRSYKNPIETLLDECRKQTLIAREDDETPIDYLKRVCDEVGTLVVIYDQFEEFFVNFKTRREREDFVSFVADCHATDGLPIKFLFSMRSDFLYLINSEFAEKIPEPLSSAKLFHLRNFNETEAADVIEKSARRANLPFGKNFSRHIARDLAEDDTVLTSELQIVGEQLQSKRIFDKNAYERTGGKESLVYSFLEDVISASGDKEGAQLLLRSLISDENTRLTLTLDEITRHIGRRHKTIERLVRLFADARLVRVIQDEEPWRYELMHEYLIDKINQISGQVMNQAQRANRLLRQYAANFALDKRTRIPLAKLWFVNRYADAPHGERERILLKKSLRSGLLKVFTVLLLTAVLSSLVAAWFSVREDWQEVRLKDGHTAAARRVVLSPDNRLLVSGGEDNKVIVWDFARRERLATLTDHTDWVNWLDFSPDGKFFATASSDKTVIVWDTGNLKPHIVLREHPEAVHFVGFTPDGKKMVSASHGEKENRRTIIWEVDGWKKTVEIPYGFEWSNYVFTPDSRQIMLPSGDTYDLTTGRQVKDYFDEPYNGVSYGVLSPDGSLLVGNRGSHVSFVEMPSRKGLSYEQAHQFHGREVAFAPDGRIAATASEDIILWDTRTRSKLFRFIYTTEAWGLAFSRDGRWLVSSYNDGAILLWDMKERKRAASFNEHSASVFAVAFSPDGKRLVSASEDQSVIVWNAETGSKEAVLQGHTTRVTGAAFSPDGNWLVSTDQNGNVIRWDIARRQLVWTSQWLGTNGIPTPNYTLSVSQNGRWIATTAGVSDSADGRQLIDFNPLQISGVYGAAFTTDSRRLALISPSGTIYTLDTETWQIVEEAKVDGTSLICGSYSPDGKWLVTGEDEGNLRLWQTNPLRQVAILGQHKARIKAVAFSPDGAEVVSSGDDQTIALWDVSRRKLITNLGTHTAPVISVAFSPDGKRIASGEQDNSVRIFTRQRTLWGYRWD